jgi:hypothetical protein
VEIYSPKSLGLSNCKAITPVPANSTDKLFLIQGARHVASVSNHVNKESVWNLPFDGRDNGEDYRGPTLPNAGSRRPAPFPPSRRAGIPRLEVTTFFCHFTRIQAGASELSRPELAAHQLAPGGNAAKVSNLWNQQIKDTGLCSVNREAPRMRGACDTASYSRTVPSQPQTPGACPWLTL